MGIYNIEGVEVEFPYEAYPIQVAYMRTVIKALSTKDNALLESPTGTGKTLCLLCAVLGWKKNYGKDIRVIYTSRTHSQLVQSISELEKTQFIPYIVHLGSRDQLCVNPDVMRLPTAIAKKSACIKYTRTNRCVYYKNLNKNSVGMDRAIIDIEDFAREGAMEQICPYYKSKQRMEKADIIFMPYNYLLERNLLKSLNIDLENTIIIFDEAHNLESAALESMSFTIGQSDLSMVTRGLLYINGESKSPENHDEPIIPVERISIYLREFTEQIRKLSESGERPIKREGGYILKLLEDSGIWNGDYSIESHVASLSHYIMMLGTKDSYQSVSTLKIMHLLENLLGGIFCNCELEELGSVLKNFVIYIDNVGENGENRPRGQWEMTFLAMDPYICFKHILKSKKHSIILTSGTLSPIDVFKSDLNIPSEQILKNDHIISPHQLYITVVKSNLEGRLIDTSYNKRGQTTLIDIGKSLVEIVKTIPGGVLVFFPSYSLMKMCIKLWKMTVTNRIYEELESYKDVYEEVSDKLDFQETIKQYQRSCQGKGGLLLAIMRGKVSEGIDFSGELAYGVVIIGIPYPSATAAGVKLRREFLDGPYNRQKELDGRRWYQVQAQKAVFQSIGRVIRNINDYGAIILMDHRFGSGQWAGALPRWCQKSWKNPRSVKDACHDLYNFFKNLGNERMGKPKTKEQGEENWMTPRDIYQEMNAVLPKEIVIRIRDLIKRYLSVNGVKNDEVGKESIGELKKVLHRYPEILKELSNFFPYQQRQHFKEKRIGIRE